MNTRQTIKWISFLGPFAVAAPLVMWQCGGDSTVTPPGDASAGTDSPSTGSSSGTGSGSSGAGSSGAGSSGAGSSGTGSSGAGSSGTGSSGAGSSGTGSSSGGGGPVLCTAPNVPAGCVDCITDANCPTATPHCLPAPASTCVVCVTSTDCGTGTTPVCQPSDHTCHASCAVDGGPRCVGATPICDTTSGACVGCRVGGNDCRVAAPICNPTTQTCVQCAANADCMGTVTPICNLANNTCVTCLTNNDCSTSMVGPVCRQATHTCAAGCVSDTQCADAGVPGVDAAAPRCNLTNNACVECLGDTDCVGGTPFCDTAAAGAGAAARTNRCQTCLPANAATDAGMEGCDGGPGSNCQVAVGVGGAGQFVCR